MTEMHGATEEEEETRTKMLARGGVTTENKEEKHSTLTKMKRNNLVHI